MDLDLNNPILNMGLDFKRRGEKCLACDRDFVFVTSFEPNPEYRHLFGVPPGKTRSFFHPICDRCAFTDAASIKISDYFLQNHTAPHRYPVFDKDLE